jgi:hypothetical protein
MAYAKILKFAKDTVILRACEDSRDTASKMQMNRGRSSRTEFKLPQDEAHTGLWWPTSYTHSIKRRAMSSSEFSQREE